MKHVLGCASALALLAGGASAAGLDRSGQSVAAIFAPEGTASLSFGMVRPSVTGTDALGNSYDVGDNYSQYSLSYTNNIGDALTYGLILDQPFGANVTYNNSPLSSTLGGTGADLSSEALTFVLKYNLNERMSVFGGIKAQRVEASVNLNGLAYRDALSVAKVASDYNDNNPNLPDISAKTLGAALQGQAGAVGEIATSQGIAQSAMPAFLQARGSEVRDEARLFALNGGYRFQMDQSTRPGYLIGAAYEIPEIAFRLAGTYHFEIEHTADTVENINGATTLGSVTFKTPQSFNLEFQTGIAKDTLLTASYRWTEFSATDVIPTRLGTDLVNLDDGHRYTLGVGRRFSDAFSGSLTLSYEPTGNNLVSPLGPTNGLFGVTVGGRYTKDNMNISGGINYSWLGDAQAEVGGTGVASFSDSSVVGIGLKVDFTF